MNTNLKKLVIATSLPFFVMASTQVLSESMDDHQTKSATPQQTNHMDVEGKKQGLTASPATPQKFEKQELKDAWLQGKIEVALTLNRHLNPLKIDTDVADGVVTLWGDVESEVDKELAGEIAQSFEDVASVNNKLVVKPEMADNIETPKDGEENWKQNIADMTTTTIVKAKLLANGETEGLAIDVTTQDDIVVLEGTVETTEEKDLAGLIAKNTDGVESVVNKLAVKKS